jgi:DNA (cytosine-5)-methyltransferase 1
MNGNREITAVDLFCGAGGLTYGLQQAGISVVAGIDGDNACKFPYTTNNGSQFIEADIRDVAAADVEKLYRKDSIRLLAGCAPCRPFSAYRRGGENSQDQEWSLLAEFSRLIKAIQPELVTMENVPGLASKPVFKDFVESLTALRYEVDFKSVYCPRFGIPQHRRRLVLVASCIGQVKVPPGSLSSESFRTVRDAIGALTPISAGGRDRRDRLHRARSVTETNLERLRASHPGGTWRDWPESLRSKCHQKESGASYQSVYARMAWDEPAPTITTQSFNFGTGRFGHPDQDRSISLREAALLQTFPRGYRFVAPRGKVVFSTLGRLIGNAVPPRLARRIGKELVRAANDQA